MPVPIKPVPAPGFKLISGKRKPTEGEYHVQSRNGLVWEDRTYGPEHLNWLHTGSDWDIAAVRRAGE